MESILEPKKISKEDFFKLKEDDLMFITNPGRMGDEDGTTFIIKKDSNYICYRISGWMYGSKDKKDYISYSEVLEQFPKWKECLKHFYIGDLEKDISDKYRYVYMGYGNGLCVDKNIFNAFYPYLVDERKKELLTIPEKDRKDISEYVLNYNSWKPAFIRTIKGEPRFYMHLDYTKILIIYESGKVQLNKINSGKITKKDYNDYKKIIKDASFVIVVGTPKLEKELFENKYVMCINNTLKIGTKNCNIKTDSEKEVDEIIKNVMETLFYTSILTYTLEDLSDDLIGKFLYKSYKVEDLENINKIICDIPQNGRSKIYISIDIPPNMDLYTLEDIINKFQENFLYSHFAFSCPMVERKEPKIHIFYEIKKDVENINYKLVGHKVKVYLKDGQEIIGSFDDDFEEEKEILVGLVCIKYNEIEKMEALEEMKKNKNEEIKTTSTGKKLYKYVRVYYDDDYSEREYSYKTDIEEIEEGDTVLVDRNGSLADAIVTSVDYYTEDEVPYPLDKTKDIIEVTGHDDYDDYDDDTCELLKIAREEFRKDKAIVHFVEDENQNIFLNDLEKYPHAFVLACLMDKQINAERAWEIPYKVYKELGNFDINYLSSIPLEKYKKMFNDGSYHRFNDTVSKQFYDAINKIKEQYDGDASKIWANNPSSATVVSRFLEFDGMGIKIATMATNILARQFKIPMSDYYSIDISPDVHVQRILKRLGYLNENATIDQVIYKAREINPEFPGLIDFSCWKIGREFCHPTNPECESCPLKNECKYYEKQMLGIISKNL